MADPSQAPVTMRARPELLGLLSAPEMQAWDRRAVEQGGIPERVLMESAGRAAARLVQRLFPEGPVAAAVGRGSNGGDALVLLRCLRAWGREVVAVPVGGSDVGSELLHGWEIPTAAEEQAAAVFRPSGVVVDGILGTGARGAPRAPQAAAVRAINESGRPVVALDGPTGVDLSDGSTPGEAVRATLTVTFGALKRGLLLYPGRACAGRIVVVEVGFPPLRADEAGAALVTPGWAHTHLPARRPNAHKGDAGAVTVVAGRAGMGGAAIMVAMGALRAGAGVVRVVSAEANRLAIQPAVPEAIFVDRAGDAVGDALEAADALVLGPGMGTDEAALSLLRDAVLGSQGPLLLDADALTLLARHPDLLPPDIATRCVLTPHPGEMGRLLDAPIAEVLSDPFGAAQRAAQRFGCCVLLKGSPSLVATPRDPVLASVAGHSGVATGGMGDTLAGVIGALLGAGAEPRAAAALGLHFAGRAAELAGRGPALLPRDVAEALPAALCEAASAPDEPDVLLDLAPPR